LRRGRDIRNNRAISSTGGVGGIGGFCSRLEEDPLPAVLGVLLAWLATLAIVTVRESLGRLFVEVMPQQIIKLFRGVKVADIPVEQPTSRAINFRQRQRIVADTGMDTSCDVSMYSDRLLIS